MTEKQEETCENCGHDKLEHKGERHSGKCRHLSYDEKQELDIYCTCKKFKAKKPFDDAVKIILRDKPKSDDCHIPTIYDNNKKAKNHSQHSLRKTGNANERGGSTPPADTPSLADEEGTYASAEAKAFNLSEKICPIKLKDTNGVLKMEDVKEAIRKLKEKFLSYNLQGNLDYYNIVSELDKIFGKELSK